MTTALKRGGKELVHDLLGCLVVNKTAWHHEHVGIVMLTDEMSDLRHPCQTGTHTVMLVERHADALAATADADTGINLTTRYALCKSMAEVGIVAAHVAICSIVFVGITVRLKILNHKFLQCEACVVASNADCLYLRKR